MSSTKTTIKYFDVMDYEKEAEYLSYMHRMGWKFSYVTLPGIYHFVKCTPARVQYQLDYNKDGAAHMDEYRRMFEDMGWEYLMDFVGYSYFRKPIEEDAEAEEIFCDDDSRWDMVKRIFRGRIVPLIVLFFLLLLPGFLRVLTQISDSGDITLAIIYGLLIVLYASIFVRFTIKYMAFKKKLGR